MKIVRARIHAGASAPFRILHISDNHVSFADGRNDERKLRLAQQRRACFDGEDFCSTVYLAEQLNLARKERLPVMHTGDLIDFVSYANLDYAKAALEGVDYFMCAGNHEYSLYVGEAWEDVPYKMQSFDLVGSYFKNDLYFASRLINGVNFVAVDDGYYRFDGKQLELMKKEVEKGLPIIILLHNPLHTDELYHTLRQGKPDNAPAYLTGTPEPLLKCYDEYRYRQQLPDADTLAFIDYITSRPELKAVLAGHIHETQKAMLPCGVMQYCIGGGYNGDTGLIDID